MKAILRWKTIREFRKVKSFILLKSVKEVWNLRVEGHSRANHPYPPPPPPFPPPKQKLTVKLRKVVIYLTNRFHFAVRLYSDNAQMTSKRGENKEVRYEPQASSVTDVLTTF